MSKLIRGTGILVQVAGGLLGLVLSLLFIYVEFGGGATMVALFIFPITLGLLPLYALFAYGSWYLLVINYGSVVVGGILHWIADKIDQQSQTAQPEPTLSSVAHASKTRTPNAGASLPVILLVIVGLILVVIASAVSQLTSAPASTGTPRPTIAPTKTTKAQLREPTATPRPVSIRACVTNSTIKIRKGPGTNFETIGGMVSDTCMSIMGRNADLTWVYMVSEDNKAGWVFASLLTIEGNLSRVSVRSSTEALSIAPTLRAVPTSTRILFITITPWPVVIQPTAKSNCSPAYPGVCIPPPPPDLDCGDIPYRRFTVLAPDPHGFDRDGDGIGCESG